MALITKKHPMDMGMGMDMDMDMDTVVDMVADTMKRMPKINYANLRN